MEGLVVLSASSSLSRFGRGGAGGASLSMSSPDLDPAEFPLDHAGLDVDRDEPAGTDGIGEVAALPVLLALVDPAEVGVVEDRRRRDRDVVHEVDVLPVVRQAAQERVLVDDAARPGLLVRASHSVAYLYMSMSGPPFVIIWCNAEVGLRDPAQVAGADHAAARNLVAGRDGVDAVVAAVDDHVGSGDREERRDRKVGALAVPRELVIEFVANLGVRFLDVRSVLAGNIGARKIGSRNGGPPSMVAARVGVPPTMAHSPAVVLMRRRSSGRSISARSCSKV